MQNPSSSPRTPPAAIDISTSHRHPSSPHISAHSVSAITSTTSSSITAAGMGVNTVALSPGPAVRRSVSPRSTSPPGSGGNANNPSAPASAASGGRCCETGRPIYTDPATGQTICSCQHEQMLQYQRLAQASLMGHHAGGPGGMHQLSMYNSAAYGPDGGGGMPPGGGAYLPGGVAGEQAHFYPNVVSSTFRKVHFVYRL